MNTGKVLGAGLDVLGMKNYLWNSFQEDNTPEAFRYLLANNVILSPHVAGWTFESHERLAQVIVDKIKAKISKSTI
jgi:D-3-phosphoglycerate dehydrogenase